MSLYGDLETEKIERGKITIFWVTNIEANIKDIVAYSMSFQMRGRELYRLFWNETIRKEVSSEIVEQIREFRIGNEVYAEYICIPIQIYEFLKKVAEKRVSVHKNFTISFESNPTTGYTWQPYLDTNFLTVIDKCYEPAENPLAVGRAGTTTFTFTPIKEGVTFINFYYRRVWERIEPLKSNTYRIIISELNF